MPFPRNAVYFRCDEETKQKGGKKKKREGKRIFKKKEDIKNTCVARLLYCFSLLFPSRQLEEGRARIGNDKKEMEEGQGYPKTVDKPRPSYASPRKEGKKKAGDSEEGKKKRKAEGVAPIVHERKKQAKPRRKKGKKKWGKFQKDRGEGLLSNAFTLWSREN